MIRELPMNSSIRLNPFYGYSPPVYARESRAYPHIAVFKNGDLALAFEKGNKCKNRSFNRDAKVNWFDYSDPGTDWAFV